MLKSDTSSLGLPYNEGAPHIVTYDDLIAARPQEEPATKVANVAISWGGALIVMSRRCRHRATNCVTKSRFRRCAVIACSR
jgi:hypothetical protein